MAIDSKNLLVWVKSMSRGKGLPLDASEVYESMTEAEAYAATATAYAGQTIKVKMDDGKYHSYTLQPSESGYILEELSAGGGTASAVPDEEMLELLAEMDVVQPLANANNNVFTDTNNNVYVL